MQVVISTSPLPFEVVISCPVPDGVTVVGSLPTSVTVSTVRDGVDGKSAYQSAIDLGFVGTEQDWQESLKGMSAYDIAVSLGFNGTPEQWEASLHANATWGVIDGDINDQADLMAKFDEKLNAALLGVANGLVPLDAGSKIATQYFPDELLGNVRFRGTYNGVLVSSALTAYNGLPLPNPVTSNAGIYFIVTAPFADYSTGDWILSLGNTGYSKVDNSDSVASVFGRIGNVTAIESDYQAFYVRLSQTYNNPAWIGSLAKSKVGLGNVDNTADVDKPVSIAQAAAIALKQDDLWDWHRSKGIFFFEDFNGGAGGAGFSLANVSGGVGSIISGTGAGSSLLIGRPNGWRSIFTGTTAAGQSGLSYGTGGTYFFSSGAVVVESLIDAATLSTATDRFYYINGFLNATSNYISPGSGCFFLYDEGNVWGFGALGGGSPNWRCVTLNGSGRTPTTTAVPVTATGQYKLKIEINAAGTQVVYSINGVIVATHTTTLPLSTTGLSWLNILVKSVGTTSAIFYIDYFGYRHTFANAR